MSQEKKFISLGNWNWILAVLLTTLLLTACKRRQQTKPPPRIPKATVIVVQPQKVLLTTELPGRISAFRVAGIRPQVSGLILKRMFTEGSDVKAGQVLYQIDPAPFQAVLDNAKAALAKAEASLPPIKLRFKRYRELVADKAVSQQNYDDAFAALQQAQAEVKYWKAQVKTALINLGYTKIIAPISGRIGKSNVTEGAIVTAYQQIPLATIQQLDPIYADVTQSTTELLRLKRDLKDNSQNYNEKDQAKVKLVLEDGTLYSHEGILKFRDVSVDPTTGSVILRMIFPNPEKILLPKMFVRAIIKESIKKHAILVPQQAVSRTTKGKPFVMVVGSGEKVEIRMLQLDRAMGNKWLVSSGLNPGDRVIVEGLQFVRPGMPVKATPLGKDKTAKETQEGKGTRQHLISKGGA